MCQRPGFFIYMTQTKAKTQPSHARGSLVVANNELPFIQQGENLLISAKLLHRKLKSGYQFADWIKRRISEYGFENGVDFFSEKTEIKNQRGGDKRSVDYLFTIDTAKELAMLEKNEVGRQIRRYFIQKEKELRAVSQLPKETTLFKGLKARRINDRVLYPYQEILKRSGYSTRASSSRRHRYWMHFVKEGTKLYITEEFAQHLYRQKQVMNNRQVMLAAQPVLALEFYPRQTKGGAL